MVTASQASLDIVVAVVGVMAVFFHYDGKAHGVYLGVLAGSQRLHDDVLRTVQGWVFRKVFFPTRKLS